VLRLALIGFGNVAREFSRLLLSRRTWLRESRELIVDVVAVATRSRGSLISDYELDLRRVLELYESGKRISEYGVEKTDSTALEVIRTSDADVMIELTPLDIESGQPATDHIRAALGRGMSVVTANKGPLAWAYDELASLAQRTGSQFRFEGTVMDGTPIFSLVERTMPGCRVLGVEGSLNSTCNLVLTSMMSGRSMEDALNEARLLGITEADPSLDIDGWDAAAKVTVLANVLMGARANPKLVERRGIRGLSVEELRGAVDSGRRVRLVARAEPRSDGVFMQVGPEVVGTESWLWGVNGTSSALTLKTDMLGSTTIVEENPSLMQTAYAVFADLLVIDEKTREKAP